MVPTPITQLLGGSSSGGPFGLHTQFWRPHVDPLQGASTGIDRGRCEVPASGWEVHLAVDSAKPATRILIAEDDGFLRDLITTILRSKGFEVSQARDGEEALEKALAVVPHLILLDVNMPQMDGYTVARRLRDDPATVGIPIIFLTAHSQDQDRKAGFEVGAARYITKPFDNQALVAVIRETLAEGA